MNPSAGQPLPVSNALLIVISAPSGGGKTTLCERALASQPSLRRVVTCTTRAPRPGERDGVDYHFLDPATFERRVAAGEFLEHAVVYGNRYGTLMAEVRRHLGEGRDVLLNIDVQGAAAVRERAGADPALREALVSVFLTPATLAVLEQRLRKRASDSEEVVQRRLAAARGEIAQWRRFDYLLVSTTIEEDLRRLLVILEAERMRQRRSAAPEGDERPAGG